MLLSVYRTESGDRSVEKQFCRNFICGVGRENDDELSPLKSSKKGEKVRAVNYSHTITTDVKRQTALCSIAYSETAFLASYKKEENNLFDNLPVSIFMHVAQKDADTGIYTVANSGTDALCTNIRTSLLPGETKLFQIVVRLSYEKDFSAISKQVKKLLVDADSKHRWQVYSVHNGGI